MKSGRFILTVGIIGCVLFLQGWFAAQTIAEETPSSTPATEPAAAGQQVPAQPPATPEPNGPPPTIFFEQTTHDFGNIAPGSNKTCEFNFENRGKGKLIISEVTKTCGCTVPELEKNEYAPGEGGILKVQYHADSGAGARTRQMYVFSNDKEHPRVELILKAMITKNVICEPAQLDYTLKGKNAGLAELTIRSLDDQPFEITGFKATSDAVAVNFTPGQKAAKFVLQTRIDTQKLAPSSNGRIEINVTYPDVGTVTVPFSVLSRFRADPPAINVLNAESGKVIQKELWVLNNYDEDFDIASAASKEGFIKVAKQEKLGNRYKLTLEITPPATSVAVRMFTDTLSIGTKDGEKVNIACRGFYLRK
jgi:hypothetical protein